MYVDKVTEVEVSSTEEAFEQFVKGWRYLAVVSIDALQDRNVVAWRRRFSTPKAVVLIQYSTSDW
jgi:hypothetical protein